jgi:hypothetical protein
MEEKVIYELRVVKTEDGFRVEVKGDREALKDLDFGPGMPPFGRHHFGHGRHHEHHGPDFEHEFGRHFGRHFGRGFARGFGRGFGRHRGPWGAWWDNDEDEKSESEEKQKRGPAAGAQSV